MKRLIKYGALLFALVLSASIIGGCLMAGVSVVRMIVDKTSENGTDNSTGDWWYWDGDGKLVFSIGNKKVVTSSEVKSGSEQFSVAEVNSLDIDVGSVELVVEAWDKDEIFVEYENVPVEYKFFVKDNTLVIDRESNINFVWNVDLTEAPRIHVSVPATKTFEKVKLDKGSGSGKLSGLQADKFYVDNGSGGVSISDCTIGKSDFNSGSGSFVVKNCSLGVATMDSGSGSVILEDIIAKDLRTDAGSGRTEVSGVLTGQCEFESGSGSLSVVVYGKEEDYNYRTDMGSGSFYLNGRKKDKDYSKRNDNAEHMLVFDAGSGRVSLDFDEDKTLSIDNVSDNSENGGSYER